MELFAGRRDDAGPLGDRAVVGLAFLLETGAWAFGLGAWAVVMGIGFAVATVGRKPAEAPQDDDAEEEEDEPSRTDDAVLPTA